MKKVMRRAWLFALAALLMSAALMAGTSGQVWAQEDLPDLQIQRFRPAPGPADYLTVFSSIVPRHLEWDVGGYLDFVDGPLQLISGGGEFVEIVDSQLTLSLLGSIALFDMFEVGLLVPVTLYQSSVPLPASLDATGASTNELDAFGINDSRLTGKWQILDPTLDAFGLAAVVGFYLPLALQERLLSDSGFTFEGRMVAESWVVRGIRVAGNLGYRFRDGEARQFGQGAIGDEVIWGLGVNVPLFISKLDAILEIDSGISIEDAPGGGLGGIREEEVFLEWRLAGRYKWTEDWSITAGLGWGSTDAVGSPDDFRGYIGISGHWVSGGSWGFDYDGDGIYGWRDKCPDEAEDYDGFEDLDGCPDPDNDGDGIGDPVDKCDNTPPGVEVGKDGCPEEDIDGDGVPNKIDKCPEDPEDLDGTDDVDGCPDPDNDGDGIPDTADRCKGDPENFNDFMDDDGCPDDPNQKVIVGKDNIVIMDQVYFASNRDSILPKSFPILEEVAKVLRENPRLTRIRIEGHTDSRGRDEYNLELSQRRAQTVRAFLIKEGIDPDRLEAVGFGETQPIATNETAEGRAKNRRVEFVILERDGAGIGGGGGGGGGGTGDILGDDPVF